MSKNIKEVPLIKVKAINRTLLEQLYHTRGELTDEPEILGQDERAAGMLLTGAGVLVENIANGQVRLVWPYRYCLGQGCTRVDDQRRFLDPLPQLFVG